MRRNMMSVTAIETAHWLSFFILTALPTAMTGAPVKEIFTFGKTFEVSWDTLSI